MLRSVDPVLDSKLNNLLSIGISEVSSLQNGYYIHIVFNNGHSMTAWNANHYYAWLQNGCIESPESKYEWVDGRPKKSTIAKLVKELNKKII